MRNPDRLDELYKELHKVHKEHCPDWRFGQFVSNYFGWVMKMKHIPDPWFVEDDKWTEWIKEYGKDYFSNE